MVWGLGLLVVHPSAAKTKHFSKKMLCFRVGGVHFRFGPTPLFVHHPLGSSEQVEGDGGRVPEGGGKSISDVRVYRKKGISSSVQLL